MRFHLLLISILIYSVSLANGWMREFLQNRVDSGLWTERCLTDISGTYLKAGWVENINIRQTTLCHIFCHIRGCLCTLTTEKSKCFLFFAEETLSVAAGEMAPMGHNMAYKKPSASTTPYSSPYVSSKAVDGKVFASKAFVTAGQTAVPWIQVDLEESYNISGIRAMSRFDGHYENEFKSIQILVGKSSGTENNFSSFKLVHFIKDGPPSEGCWYYIRLQLTEPYQFVTLRKINDDDQLLWPMNVQELEVLV